MLALLVLHPTEIAASESSQSKSSLSYVNIFKNFTDVSAIAFSGVQSRIYVQVVSLSDRRWKLYTWKLFTGEL